MSGLDPDIAARIDRYWAEGISIGQAVKLIRKSCSVDVSFEQVRRRFADLADQVVQEMFPASDQRAASATARPQAPVAERRDSAEDAGRMPGRGQE